MLNLFALPHFGHTRVIVWYQTPKTFRFVAGVGIKGLSESSECHFKPIMGETHIALCDFYTQDSNAPKILDHTFSWLQEEHWSPIGEANEYIQQLGLSHTSMSVGDVVQIGERFFACEPVGWEDITDSAKVLKSETARLYDGLPLSTMEQHS